MPKADASEKWNKKYSAKAKTNTPTPPIYLCNQQPNLKRGRCLDIACGDGAASLFMARQGWDVTVVDFSSEGFERLAYFSEQLGLSINTHQIDLESEPELLADLGQFDIIVISRYKPSERFWRQIDKNIAAGGQLLFTTFNELHHQRTGFSKRFCLQHGESLQPNDQLTLVDYQHDINQTGMDGYLFTKG